MTKSNLFKSAVLLVLMAVMFMATAMTAYAATDYDTADSGEYENIIYEDSEEHQSDLPDYDEIPAQDELPNQDEPLFQELPLGSLIIINSTHDGLLLPDAVFAIYSAGDNTHIADLTTDTAGRTEEIPLPQGNYNIVILTPAHGHATITDVVSTTITSGQRQELTIYSVPIQTPTPTPEPTPQPTQTPVDTGRLLITLRAKDSGQLLGGAVYELRKAIDGGFIAYLITDGFGEAAYDLPTGDYFLRETQAVSGFIPNPDRVNVRIAANRINEVNLTSRPEPTPPSSQESTTPEQGRLIITVRANGTKEPLQGAELEVRRAIDNHLVAELVTDRFGEAAVSLPPDDYFIRQIAAVRGYVFDTERINVRIAEKAVREVSIINKLPTPTPPPAQTPPPVEAAQGRLLITVLASDTGERLEGVVYTIHDIMTDEIIDTITTNAFGEASAILLPGQYYKRNAAMPQGYSRDLERVNFSIRGATITNKTVTAKAVPQPTPTPTQQPAPSQTTSATQNRPSQPQNRVEIITRAEQSGSALNGTAFSVYRVNDNQRMGEATTDVNGKSTISLSPGEYYLRNDAVQYDYLREQSRIFFTVKANGNITVEVTIQRDESIPDADIGNITVPKTGELPPVMNYVLGSLLLVIALFCGVGLLSNRKHKSNKRKGVLAYA